MTSSLNKIFKLTSPINHHFQKHNEADILKSNTKSTARAAWIKSEHRNSCESVTKLVGSVVFQAEQAI